MSVAPSQVEASPGGERRGGFRFSNFDPMAVGLILVIFATEAVIGILLLAINPDYPQRQLHEKVLYTSLAISVYFASKTLGQPIGGWLADRIDPRTVLIGGLIANLPAIVIMERFQSIWVYIGAWVGFGVTLAVVWPTVYAIVGARFRASLHGQLLAAVSMGQIAGTVTGVGIGAVLVDQASYFAAFAAAFTLAAVSLLIALTVVRGGQRAAAISSAGGLPVAGWRELRNLLTLNVMLLILLIMLLSGSVAMLTPDIGPYRDRTLHLTASQFALLLAPPAVIAAALLVPAGYIADRFGRNLPLGVGMVIFPASLLLMSFTAVPVLASLFASCAAIGYVLCLPALSASLLDLSSVGNRGLLTGFSTAIQAIGGVVAPPIGGLLIDGFGPLAPFRASAGVMAATFVLALVYAARTRNVYRDRVNAGSAVVHDRTQV